ncbi:hypothetical protein roselon_02516 [Roseibacterium elongatum DSM 19469]|uniref:Uncharacterized protein n=1 Tax=Roseicyclus elongatus DSM 19469 TaxID=1294273 RepID=W8S3Q6_9RHOB|nr:hypothetical protein [Roseibacterium elongatum]AHM04837.1 hypothetical protein roselon_02516 [Roseibacterium elongatum DSM 19469]
MQSVSEPEAEQLPRHGMTRPEWIAHLSQVGAGHGFLERIGARHLGLFVEEGDTLLISFDRAERVYADSADGMPAGFEMVPRREWSFLSLMSIGRAGFRDAEIHAFFDRLVDEGVFDSFERVLFLGLGPANGHAACAYSAAAPGARVIASRPAARIGKAGAAAERYGNAPALLSACEAAVLMHDPREPGGRANAELFADAKVTQVSLPCTAPDLEATILDAELLSPMFRAMANLRLDAARLREILRPVLRANGDYLMRLATQARRSGHPRRAAAIARHGMTATGEDRFAALLSDLGVDDRPNAATG